MFARTGMLVVAVLCLGATECSLDEDLGPEDPTDFETLEYDDGTEVKGDASGIASKQLLVIRDINAFTEFWADHAAGFAPQPAQPVVEFGTDMIIGAFMGERSTSGYKVTIEDVRENDVFIVVDIELETPGDNCATEQVVTQPHHVIVLPDSDLPVQFSESVVEAPEC
ncbi:MAG TPA: protease complex subunit PrcB family protein [Gammaproteobacteria bacterium]